MLFPIRFYAMFLPLLAVTVAAHAQESAKRAAGATLTVAQIESLYDLGATMHMLPYEKYLAAYDTVFSPDFRVRNIINLTVPPQPPMQTRDTQTLADYKDAALKTYEGMRTAEVSHQITALTIAPNGQSATVTDATTVKHARDPAMGDHAFMNMRGRCSDTVVMGPAGRPQIKNSDCIIDVTVVMEQEL